VTAANENAPSKRTIQERFDAWLALNPDVYPTIVGLAREAKRAGKRRTGMKMLWEVTRWQLRLRTRGDDFKLNNDYCAPLVRLVQEREPDLAGMFETRKRRAK
jgi:hypothetical protein